MSGDFNYNMLAQCDVQVLKFNNLLSSYSYLPVINKATRIQNEKKSLLDNFFMNDPTIFARSGVILDDLADHFPIFFALNVKQNKENRKIKRKMIFDKTKTVQLNDFLCQKLRNFDKHTDANDACDELLECYVEGIDKFSKVIKTSSRKHFLNPG